MTQTLVIILVKIPGNYTVQLTYSQLSEIYLDKATILFLVNVPEGYCLTEEHIAKIKKAGIDWVTGQVFWHFGDPVTTFEPHQNQEFCFWLTVKST